MRIRLLGTGTPTPSLRRMSSGYMVEVGNDVLLFDHGPGAHHRMLEAGVPATRVSHVFFSHLHYDHCLDYARLLLTRWDHGRPGLPELKAYGPPFLKTMTERLIGPDGAFGPDIEARTRHQISIDMFVARGGTPPRPRPQPEVHEMRSGETVEGDGWTVTARSVIHVQPYLVCYGFRLDTPEGSFVYSGDTGPCTAMRKLAEGCDVLVHMCHYISGTEPTEEYARACTGHLELAELAAEAGVRNLVISHVLEQMDVPGVRERLVCEMGRIYSGNILFGEDLMEVPLGAPRPDAFR